MQKFARKYRIQSARRPGWDYLEPKIYSITICTKGRECWFGEIRNGIMGLSDIGCVVHDYWMQIPDYFSHVMLDGFIVMPNHIHGIIAIIENSLTVETCESHVSTMRQIFSYSLRVQSGFIIDRPKPGSIGSIIGQFKSSCTKRIRNMGYNDFAWQPRFHDRIIRNNKELQRKKKYIFQNPKKWNSHEDIL